MPRPEKEAAVKEIAEILENAKSVFVTDFQGINVEKMNEFRRKCREVSVSYIIVKNTLARLAAKKAGWSDIEKHFQGPSAIAFSYDDPSAPAKVITEFARVEKKPSIKMSIFEGTFYGPDSVNEVATLPPKDVLLGKIVSGLNSPIQGLTSGLSGLIQKLVRTVDAVRESQSKT